MSSSNPIRRLSRILIHARLLFAGGRARRGDRRTGRPSRPIRRSADSELSDRLGLASGIDQNDDGTGHRPCDDPEPDHRVTTLASGPTGKSFPPQRKSLSSDPRSLSPTWAGWTFKEEIRLKIIHPLSHPELYKAYGKAIGGGILMYGPPGCGKTHLARATAGEINAGFMSVGIHDVLDMWLGNSERNLHELFEQARRNRPCVLFFDEVDALAASRSDMRGHGGRQLINQFLSEIDGDPRRQRRRACCSPPPMPPGISTRPSAVPAGSTASSSFRLPTRPPARPSCD